MRVPVPLSRSRFAGRAVLVVCCTVLAGCAGGVAPVAAVPDVPAPAPVAAPPPGTVDGRFPVTVDHQYGRTVVVARPRRVASVGTTDHDALLALGIVPVGTEQVPDTLPSWSRERFDDARPRPVQALQEPGVHGFVTFADPDLIVSASTPLTPETYDADRGIAPTIAGPPGAVFGVDTSWQDTTRLVGQAVGRPVAAERLVDDLEARFAAARARYPRLAGRTAVCVSTDGHSDELYRVEPAGRSCPRVLADLGLRGVPALQDPDGAAPGAERYGYGGVYADAFTGANRPDLVVPIGRVTGLPADVPVVTLDGDDGLRLSYPSVLGLPAAVDRVAATLSAALR